MHKQTVQEEMVEKRTSINISKETHAELNSIGARGESFDDIIRKCIKAYKQVHKS